MNTVKKWVADKISNKSQIQKEIETCLKVIKSFEDMAEEKFREGGIATEKFLEAQKRGHKEFAESTYNNAQQLINAGTNALLHAAEVEKKLGLLKEQEMAEKTAKLLRKVTAGYHLAEAKPVAKIMAAKAGFSRALENASQDNEIVQSRNPIRRDAIRKKYSSMMSLNLNPIAETEEVLEWKPIPRPRTKSLVGIETYANEFKPSAPKCLDN